MPDTSKLFQTEGGESVEQITDAFEKFVPSHTRFSHIGSYETNEGEIFGYVFFSKNPGPQVGCTSLNGRFTIPIVAALLVARMDELPFKPDDGGIIGMRKMWAVDSVNIVKGCLSVRACLVMGFPDQTHVH